MKTVLTVRFGDGDVAEQLFQLKLSALRNHDLPALWRLTDVLIELLVQSARTSRPEHWPKGYVREDRLFGVPVDCVHDMPHLLCEEYMIYPYVVSPPRLVLLPQ